MISIHEVIQKLLFRQGEEEGSAGFSNAVYWTDLVSGSMMELNAGKDK